MTPEQVLEAARLAVDLALSLVPKEAVQQLLDEQAVKRANVAADVAEQIKFAGTE